MQTFDAKDPSESVNLTFNMASNLPLGVFLNGTITVAVSVLENVDPNPNLILNGPAGLDATLTQVVQPVTAGLSGVLYEVKVQAATTLPSIVLVLAGALPVRNAQ